MHCQALLADIPAGADEPCRWWAGPWHMHHYGSWLFWAMMLADRGFGDAPCPGLDSSESNRWHLKPQGHVISNWTSSGAIARAHKCDGLGVYPLCP